MRKTMTFLVAVLFLASGVGFAQTTSSTQQEIQQLKQMMQKLQQRLQQLEQETKANAQKAAAATQKAAIATQQAAAAKNEATKNKKKAWRAQQHLWKLERKAGLDRINFSGDFRFEAHTINADIPSHYDGMMLQNLLVNSMFYMGANGMPPTSIGQMNNFIANNYGKYQYFSNNLTFNQLKQAMGKFPPQLQQQLFGMFLPATHVNGYKADNDIMYTNRLRLFMDAKVAKNVSFHGRLAMYKVWGNSNIVQLFNGQPNTMYFDGNTVSVPGSDILRVERAFFTWKDIAGLPIYISIGRRPSTGGPPLNLRQAEPRGGTPMGTLIDFQFDGVTFGWHPTAHQAFRVCYGVGYESGYGDAEVLKQPADRLRDATFFGFNFDLYNSDTMLIQTTVARAADVTDGFGGLVVMPNNPVTGAPIGAPIVMRFVPSADLGNIDIGGVLVQRKDGPFNWFVNYNWMNSDPKDATTPFGGLFCDPFEKPKSQSGDMIYVGGRYNFNDGDDMVGVEYNHGSKYWFNFTPAQDDIIAPKTNTRGDVWEAYFIHKIARKFLLKLDYINYDYHYSGSGWHMGTPKRLDSNPILGFPTYKSADMWTLSMTARF